MVKSRAELSETHCVDRIVQKEEKIWLRNTVPWDPVLILETRTSRAARVKTQNLWCFWEQKHQHGLERKGTALTEGYRQHLKDYHIALRNVGVDFLMGILCGFVCLPLYRLCVRTTAKSQHMPYMHVQSDSCSERALFPWREATWNQVELVLCSVSVCDHESCTSKIMRLPRYEGMKELLIF